jgi:TolB protein
VRAQFSIHDTTLKTGATYALSAKQADRFNNLRAESVPIVDKTPAVCTWANDKVTTTSMGRCVLTSSFAQTTDSTTASVVPNARFAVVGGGAVGLISSDGTNYRKVIGIVDYSVSPGWSPDGSKVVIYEGDPYSYSSISVVDTLGNRLAQVGKDISFFYSAMFGRFSPDGQWVYFSGRQTVNDAVTGIWRMAPNGTNIQSVLSSSQTFPFSVAQHVNFSPNGAKLAFDIGSQIAVLDIATNQPTLLGVSGVTPSYSPDGQQIAFYGTSYYPSALKVMNADGSNVRTLSNGDFGIWQTAQWTPDGAWLLVQPSSAGLMYVNVADGSTLPLSYGAPYGQPAVRPN